MNPFLYFQRELEADGSDDTVSAALRYLLALWSDVWADSPSSYAGVYHAIADRIYALPRTPLREEMLQRVVYLCETRPGHPYTAA